MDAALRWHAAVPAGIKEVPRRREDIKLGCACGYLGDVTKAQKASVFCAFVALNKSIRKQSLGKKHVVAYLSGLSLEVALPLPVLFQIQAPLV